MVLLRFTSTKDWTRQTLCFSHRLVWILDANHADMVFFVSLGFGCDSASWLRFFAYKVERWHFVGCFVDNIHRIRCSISFNLEVRLCERRFVESFHASIMNFFIRLLIILKSEFIWHNNGLRHCILRGGVTLRRNIGILSLMIDIIKKVSITKVAIFCQFATFLLDVIQG